MVNVEQTRLRVSAFLELWTKMCPYDFLRDRKLIALLHRGLFASDEMWARVQLNLVRVLLLKKPTLRVRTRTTANELNFEKSVLPVTSYLVSACHPVVASSSLLSRLCQ